MTQEEIKRLVGQAAADYVNTQIPEGAVIGVGTGSTVNYFIDALASQRNRYRGAISSSIATTHRLISNKFRVFELCDIEFLPIYVDGADEIDSYGAMIKGGGGALTREKIVSAAAEIFVCIVDDSKVVQTLGKFPLPLEVMPIARLALTRRLAKLSVGTPVLRLAHDGKPFITENGNEILDINGLVIENPIALECSLNQWPGIVTVGLFAAFGANLCLVGTKHGVQRINYVKHYSSLLQPTISSISPSVRNRY
ncbi:ribose-5-phosphate isomerase RpiA [Candidatus Vallotiella sp. (ex Adelges kitamiensis)]|uniref:ribose-5-phosphate isomerase RpiA n=1 Tax=Candidatus Vallotiella sp. (ex Adelges kitamiensis) TaxID=2864217 RepID=UPI001CE292CB|nr:ribose-5-phosphate isomerase RpiA [Candidatus Vallotia sp. (ex Adelges kitamiensis)]